MKAAILCSAAALFSGRDLVAGVGMLCGAQAKNGGGCLHV
jgi:hypothetical protein